MQWILRQSELPCSNPPRVYRRIAKLLFLNSGARALDQGLSYRQVQMMSGHRDPKTVMRYDHHRENMEQNAVNFLSYEEAPRPLDQKQDEDK